MDGKVNLPDLAADVNWQGLEDLYSVNESVYEYRQDYRLSPGDWTNYLKDVDRVFALLNSHHEQSKANESEGFLAESPKLSVPGDLASPESDEEALMRMVGKAPHLSWPADLRTLHLNKPTFSPESTLEWNNDIPEVGRLNSEHWRNHKTEKWMEQKEMNHLETDFSGNGLMEPVLPPGPILQPLSGHRKGFTQHGGLEEHAFKDQLHLPVYSGVESVHPATDVPIRKQPGPSSSVKRMVNEVGGNHTAEGFPGAEGSASLPLSFD